MLFPKLSRTACSKRQNWQVIAVLLCFTFLGWFRHLHNTGEDLASSYVGCRLLAAHEGEHLFSYSSTDFSKVSDPVWDATAQDAGFAPLRLLHPYVQTPLWAYSLMPFCTRMRFRAFYESFLLLFMLCLSGLLWLVARYWTPALFHPLTMALVYFGLYRTEPFKYAIFLGQTHILYLFLTVFALVLADRGRESWAGVLLAFAAAVKITPGFLVLYWVATRRYRAAGAFVAASATLFLLNFVLPEPGLTGAYVRSLARNSQVLLLAFNNQSLAAWWMGLHAPRSAALHWTILPLPTTVKTLSMLLTMASCVAGGLMDRGERLHNAGTGKVSAPPCGAAFALLGITLFASIAWTHYFLVLVIPVMFFLQSCLERRTVVFAALIALVLLLNLYPISFGSVDFVSKSFTVIRSQFYAGVLAMAGLLLLRYRPWQVRLEARHESRL